MNKNIEKMVRKWNKAHPEAKISVEFDDYWGKYKITMEQEVKGIKLNETRSVDEDTLIEWLKEAENQPDRFKLRFVCQVGYCRGDIANLTIDDFEPVFTIDGEKEYNFVCPDCRDVLINEDEPALTVYYDGEMDEPYEVGTYRDDTDGDFKPVWHATDLWRGYYDVVPSKRWKRVHTDAILHGSEDAEQLKAFNDALIEALKQMGIHFAIVFSRTSNVFSTGYDFFVEAEKADMVQDVIEELKRKYRDEWRFNLTALTGKDLKNADEKDKLFTLIASLMLAGDKNEEQ